MNIKNDSECKEYNSLKYKTMIMNGTNIESSVQTNEDKINHFLTMDIEQNKKGVWSKLSKTEKIKKIKGYIKNNLVEKYKLTDNETINANRFFSLLMDRKKLSKNNELNYNQEEGLIENIEGLSFNVETRKFTMNFEKVTPKKKTVKNIINNVNVNNNQNDKCDKDETNTNTNDDE